MKMKKLRTVGAEFVKAPRKRHASFNTKNEECPDAVSNAWAIMKKLSIF